MVGTGGGGLRGNGITKAVVDVSGPQARGEQAERRNQKTAVHTEKLIPICDSQLEGADGLGRRNEVENFFFKKSNRRFIPPFTLPRFISAGAVV